MDISNQEKGSDLDDIKTEDGQGLEEIPVASHTDMSIILYCNFNTISRKWIFDALNLHENANSLFRLASYILDAIEERTALELVQGYARAAMNATVSA